MKITVGDLKKVSSQLRSDLTAARGMVSLATGLREYFREPVTLKRANDEIRREVETREPRFLELVQNQVYERPASPYLRLLEMAGCEFSDFRGSVRSMGLEKTLEKLAAEGVFLTSEEFKGRKEVVRGKVRFRVGAEDFRLRDERRGVVLNQSSGTSGQAQRYAFSLDRTAESSRLRCIFFEAHDLFRHSLAIFDAILPSSGGLRHLLGFSKCGIRIDRWFARRVMAASVPEAIFHRIITGVVVLATKTFGPGGPWPEYLDNEDVGRIVTWMVEKHETGNPCCLRTTVSNAVKVARTAEATGKSLSGATFIASGEPLTESKRTLIESVGARTIPCYGCAGLGEIGYGCGRPGPYDDFHLPSHRLALIQHPKARDIAGTSIHPFLFSTLAPSATMLHINVENGDFGVIEGRGCGCALESAGLTVHLHHISSFEKLTSEGMSLFFADLIPLIEISLPSEFGGGPGDYQLVEEEDDRSQTRLTLVVHPDVKQLDEEGILNRIRAALAEGSRNDRFTSRVWQDANTFRVRREVPYASDRGKILPLRLRR